MTLLSATEKLRYLLQSKAYYEEKYSFELKNSLKDRLVFDFPFWGNFLTDSELQQFIKL